MGIFNEVRNIVVVVGGDGCCDSLGYLVKYGIYSIVDIVLFKVFDFFLV